MSAHMKKELEKLKKLIFSLGTQVDENVEMAARAFDLGDTSMVEKVIQNDKNIDQLEVEVEEACLKALALYQPVAIDLRFIVAVLKMTNDLERMSDLAAGVAKNALIYNDRKEQNIASISLSPMSELVTSIVRKSIDSLLQLDSDLAREVTQEDQVIDEMKREMKANIIKAINQDPAKTEPLVALLMASNRLERIGDHATNIAEDVIYMVEAEIVRHQDLDKKTVQLIVRLTYFLNYASSNNQVDRYRSPVSHTIVTISLPSFSGRFACSTAAYTLPPAEIPQRIPSSFAN